MSEADELAQGLVTDAPALRRARVRLWALIFYTARELCPRGSRPAALVLGIGALLRERFVTFVYLPESRQAAAVPEAQLATAVALFPVHAKVDALELGTERVLAGGVAETLRAEPDAAAVQLGVFWREGRSFVVVLVRRDLVEDLVVRRSCCGPSDVLRFLGDELRQKNAGWWDAVAEDAGGFPTVPMWRLRGGLGAAAVLV